jgi:hypothetical protein
MTFEDYELRTTPPAGSGRYLDISGKSRRTEEPVDSFQILQPKLHEFGNFHQVNPTHFVTIQPTIQHLLTVLRQALPCSANNEGISICYLLV